ncbi:hypothetical protein SUGI_1105170 [Cryptomeria japonica]|nr:hypothetical protein SUGI_1105170 [Cryptomeria japonica]
MGNAFQCCTSLPAVMSPSHAGSPLPPPIGSLVPTIQQLDPNDQIDLLIDLIEVQLQRIKALPEKSSISSSLLDSVAPKISLAATIIDIVSTEADKLFKTDLTKGMGRLVLDGLRMVGEAHWIFVGLAVAAYALERGVSMRCNVSECINVLEEIGFLAKDLKRFKEANPGETDRLCKAVQIIVEGAITCCDYISKGSLSRYWSACIVQNFLQKVRESIRDIRSSLTLTAILARQNSQYIEPSIKLLDFEPVGIESQVSEVKDLIDIKSNDVATTIILFGNGGIGKTTLASQVIQQLNLVSTGFKFCRVIIDDKTPDKIIHIIKLQRDIIRNLGGGKIKLENPENGQNKIREIIANKCILLFIDKVVDSDYIRQLLPRHLLQPKKTLKDEHSQKLRILITSRASNLPVLFEDIKCKEYRVNSLSEEAAKCLLQRTILKDETKFHQEFDEEHLLDDVAVACKGIPLLLSVYGNHLRVDRKKKRYQEALDGLKMGDFNRFPEEQLEEKILFVYHKLKDFDVEARDAFLDICSYFQGWEWNVVSAIVGENRLETLHKRMLVSRSEIKNQVVVHDILLLMGRKEAKNTRFLNSMESLKALKDKSNLQTIQGICLLDNTSLMTLESRDLNAMHTSLRVLQIGNWVNFDGPPCDKEFENLRYLHVGDINAFPFQNASKLKQLKVFYNHSKQGIDLPQLPETLMRLNHDVKQLEQVHEVAKLPNRLKLPASLQYLQLSNVQLVLETLNHLHVLESLCLDKCDIEVTAVDLQESSKWNNFPEGLKLPVSLQNLIVNNCKGLPQTLSHLNALKDLFLTRCDMEIMPRGFRQLSLLKTLSLEYCANLSSLPKGIGSISSLTSVNLNGCTRLQELPADFGKLIALKDLRMGGCENLTSLPENMGGLSSLQVLDLTGCIMLQNLPESFGSLSIQRLNLHCLTSLEKLPETTGNLGRLKYLSVNSCESLTGLPDSFVQLRMLEELRIHCCENLVSLPKNFGQLISLTLIEASCCPSLKDLPHGFEELPALKELSLMVCSKLVTLPACIEQLACLEWLALLGIPLSTLPSDLGKLKNLKWLWISSCNRLRTFPDDFDKMASLEKLTIHRCEMMEGKELERVVKLQKCYSVDICRSPNLVQRWKEMQQAREDYPFEITASSEQDEYEWHRATKAGLFHGRCIELDSMTNELIEHTSVFVGENTTVAVIRLPFDSNHSLHFQRLVGRAMQRQTSGTTELLRIFYLKDTDEEESIREVLKHMPEGSWVIPSSEIRRFLLLQYLLFNVSVKDICFIADVRLDEQGRQIFVDSMRIGEDEIVGRKVSPTIKEQSENVDFVTRYIDQISLQNKVECAWKIFAQALKQNGICHFDSRKGQV